MKLKSLAAITLLVLGCSAAFAQGSVTLGFASPGDLFLSCDYEQLQWGGDHNLYATGKDILTACDGANNAYATMACVKAPTGVGGPVPVDSPAYACADNLIDAFGAYYTGEQWLLITQTKPSTRIHHWGWVGYLGFYGYEFLDNYGYLTASYPGHTPKGKPVLGKTTVSGAPQSNRARTITK